jgi:membrane protease YdiL (CAAX protease family)
MSSLRGAHDQHDKSMTALEPAPADTWIRRHRLISYFALAYAISWPLWLLSRLAGGTVGTVLLVIGAFGPPLAAAITIRLSGGSLSEWLRAIIRWRVPVRFYGYALGLPVLIMAVMNVVLAALGQEPKISLLVGRIPAYAQTLLITAVIFGGQEEPGWRGFALPRLEERHAPLVATLILGLGWGVWHIPLYGLAGFVVPLVLAFFYSWLYNRTQSVLLCILLHASFTAAQDHLLLFVDSPMVDIVLLGSYVVGAAVLIAVTRGRLGKPVNMRQAESEEESNDNNG